MFDRLLICLIFVVGCLLFGPIGLFGQDTESQPAEEVGSSHMSVDGVLGFRLGTATSSEALTLHCPPEVERITYNIEPEVVAHTFEVIKWQGDLDLDLSAPTMFTLFSEDGLVVACRMDIDFRHNSSDARDKFKNHFKSRLGWEPAVSATDKYHALQWIDEDDAICQFYEMSNGSDVLCWASDGKAVERCKYLFALRLDNGILNKPETFIDAPIKGFNGFELGFPIESAAANVGEEFEYVGKKNDPGGRFEAVCFHSISSPISTINVDPTQGAFIFVLVSEGKIHEVSVVFLHGTYKPSDLDDTMILYKEKYGESLTSTDGIPYWTDYWNATKIEFKKSDKFNWIEYSDLSWMDVSVIELFEDSKLNVPDSKNRI